MLARQLLHEVRDEPRDVLLALAQRRHEDRDHVEAEEQVLTEAPGANLGGEVLVGRGQHAHVDAHAVVPADRIDDLLLQHAQHLGLRLQAHVGHFVEEDRAVVGQFEAAAPVATPRR